MIDEPIEPVASSEEETPRTPTAIEVGRAAAAEQNTDPGMEVIECPTCHSPRRRFLIIDDKCDSCRTRGQQAAAVATTLGWPEVRHRRNMLLRDSDATQVPDRPNANGVASRFRAWREELRNVTTQTDPFLAWYELDRLETIRPSES